MLRAIKRNDGITLIELITVMVISTLLIMVSAVGISTFYKRYKVITDFIALQTDAMACLQTIRNGYGFGGGAEFYGVANARQLTITGNTNTWGVGSGIHISPPSSKDYQASDWVEYYLDHGVIKMNYVYNGIQVDTPQYIFPDRELVDKIEVTRFAVSDANATGSILPVENFPPENIPTLLKVELDARVLVRENERPKPDEYKSISYTTYMVKK